ncbi:MAG: DUF885 domain-containing protein [Candidatus Marinimicrobia bacterium]|nr:DUF885 domain-containing protein [Candidatus Neomarinimicrobiota bacterium]
MKPPQQFEDLVDRFYDDYFNFNPTLGRQMGFKQYLGKIPDFAYETIMGFHRRLQFYLIEVKRLQGENLDRQSQTDLKQLELTVEYETFAIHRLCWWAEDPMAYAEHLDVSHYMKRNYAPLEERILHVTDHLSQVAHFLEQQRFNLKPVQPRINLVTAIEMYQGYRDFYRGDVLEFFQNVADGRIRSQLDAAVEAAAAAVKKFVLYMEEELLPAATEEFTIGRFKFIDMLQLGEMVDIELDQLLKLGETDLEQNRKRFESEALSYLPDKKPQEAMQEIASNHPSPESLISDTADMLEQIRQFLIDNELVTVPSEVRILVEETPGFMRWAFAMCDPPGPFEEVATESFYYVTNVHPDWSDRQKEEWLTKFDYATLDNISVHEAYPGHYVHYQHTLSAPSKVAKIAGAYSFWEGWAHYSEEMMLDEGWHAGEPQYRLAQLSEALLRDCRYICAIKMHTGGMTVDEATTFFMENSYMEETPARKEAERGTYDPGYLNYTLGKLMLLKLREDWKRQEGRKYSLKRFHDTLLSFGAPPLPLVRELMLEEMGEIL